MNPVLHPKSTLTFAHGSRKYGKSKLDCVLWLTFLFLLDKMARQMEGDDNVLRTKILQEINEDFH